MKPSFRNGKLIYICLISLIFLGSFRFFSALYYPALNSDNAITILMIHYFKLPADLYFWGQDRMGSLIPLLAQFFTRGLGFSAIWAESVTHYLILLAGYLAAASFIKSWFYRTVLAVFWFFPMMRMIDVTQFAFGIHYSLIAICCFLILKKDDPRVRANAPLFHSVMTLLTILGIAAVWVSDMAMISVFVLLAAQVFFFFRKHGTHKHVFKQPELYYALGGMAAGTFFIGWAKSLMLYRAHYAVVGDWATIAKTTGIFLQTLGEAWVYNPAEPFSVVYSYLLIILLIMMGVRFRKIRLDPSTRKVLLIFVLDAVLLLGVILGSEFTLISNVPRRYFTCTYMASGMAILLLLDHMQERGFYRAALRLVSGCVVITGAVGMLYTLKYQFPGTMTPRAELSAEFRSLGKPGIIADYWNSYIVSCVDPENIKATQCDLSPVRNQGLTDEVLLKKNIYVIADGWLTEFPDTLCQFHRRLIRGGPPFVLGNSNVCMYLNPGDPCK